VHQHITLSNTNLGCLGTLHYLGAPACDLKDYSISQDIQHVI